MPEPRRTFGPVVLLGLAAGVLAAVAGNRAWVAPDDDGPGDPLGLVDQAGQMPLAAALSLVVLACWGVVLVTRRRVRRAVAVLALLASVGLVATVAVGASTVPDQVADALRDQQVDTGAGLTGWFWAAVVGSLVSLVATLGAVRFVPAWPEMGSRYDAPSGAADESPAAAEGSSLDLWRAMDEGRDPTA